MAVGRGYGKLLLFGEHAAVHGHPAVGVQLDRYLEVEIEPHGEAWDLGSLEERAALLVRRAIEALPEALGRSAAVPLPPGGTLRIRGSLPMSAGFGSSAAFCTALLRAFGAPFTSDRRPMWRAAHRLEQVFHGTPSGIDTGLSVYPGASLFVASPPGLPRRKPARLPAAALVVGALPRDRSTAELVASVRNARDRDRRGTDAILGRLGEVALAAVDPALCPTAAHLGRLADEAHELLRELGVSSGPLEEIVHDLRVEGALGAKLSGAGGGGAFYGVFESADQARRAAARMSRAGGRPRLTAPFVVELGLL